MLTASPPLDLDAAYAEVVAILDGARDIVLGRVEGRGPEWIDDRGWRPYLLSLGEAALERADTLGIAPFFLADPGCPPSLRELARRTASVLAALPRFPQDAPPVDFPHMNPRKRGQVAAILRILREAFADLTEIVDVGAGRGQLTTRAAAALAIPAVGIERDPDRVAMATALAGGLPVRFVTADALSPTDNPLAHLPASPHRLVMALHGCGQLGDAVVTGAAASGASVLLLGCCPQKIRGREREALVPGGPSFPKEILGLGNVLSRTAGVEGELAPALASKEARLALRYLIAGRGTDLPPGEEMRGVNRRRVQEGFAVFAQAVCQVRGWPPPTTEELAMAGQAARAHYLAQRRFSLPRSMLGRPLELFLALDRARYLRRRGYAVQVGELFPATVSPRNVAVIGRARCVF